MFATRTALRPADVAIRAAIVALTLSTAYIHSTLGGLLFTLNAVGYVVAAIAMVVPLAIAVRFRWVVRVGLIGYAATAIVAWAVMGPYFTTAYVAKAHRGRADRHPRHRLRPPRRQPRRASSGASSPPSPTSSPAAASSPPAPDPPTPPPRSEGDPST